MPIDDQASKMFLEAVKFEDLQQIVQGFDDSGCDAAFHAHHFSRYGPWIHTSRFRHRLKTVRWMLENVTDVNTIADYAWISLSYDCCHDEGRDSTFLKKNGETRLYRYVSCHKFGLAVATFLIHHGVDVNKPDSWHHTPLSIACFLGYLDVVRLLIDNGADVNRFELGKSPLRIICYQGNLELFHFLIVNGASVNAANDLGETALSATISERQHDESALIVEELIRNITQHRWIH